MYGTEESLAYPSGEEGGNFLLQMILTSFPRVEEEGGGRHIVRQTISFALDFTVVHY